MTTIADTLVNAVQLHQSGDLQQAEKLYKQLLQSNPDDPALLHSLGVVAYQTGKHDKAVELITKAIAGNQRIPQFHNTLGLVFEAFGKFEKAIAAYQQAVSLKPDYAEAYHNMAIAVQSQGRYADAVEKCIQALSLRPDYAQAYNTMAFSLEKQNHFADAIENYRKAIHYKPDFVEAYNHLGVLLNDQGRSSEAIENYRLALGFDAKYAELYNNLGIALKEQEQFAEAIENFKYALRLEPEFAEAYYNLANSLRDQGLCAEAIDKYRKAIQLKTDYAQAHWNMSLALLLNGDFAEGWKEYRWRRNAELNHVTDYHHSGKPRWDGSSFAGKRLFVHYEQGLGDNIQFVRYLHKVKARGGTVILETLKPLINLFKDFLCIDELVEYHHGKSSSVSFDIYTSLMDLPNIFGTTLETIPSDVPYIYADRAKAEYWQNELAGPDFKVGIVWAGSPVHGNDRYRSCSLECFAPLSDIQGVRLYGLQKGHAAAQIQQLNGTMSITDISNKFEDFTDTTAAIQNLDLVISVDTSVLHLAGAMGKPTWALLPYAPEWRWMLNRQDSPWYPTMKLFRQKEWGRWEPVFQQVTRELLILVQKHKPVIRNIIHTNREKTPVIIPSYKNRYQLEKCITQLKNQSLDVEIFVRDNSNDNIYFTAAVNEGISKYMDQPSKYVLILNQDMYLEPDAVEKMVTFMDAHPECGIGAPLQLDCKNPNYVNFGGGYEAFPAGKHQHGLLSEFTQDKQIPWCNGACMILRKEMIRNIGLLDENFVFIGSDSDYCFTARSRGWQVWRIAGARGIHEYGASGLSSDLKTEKLKVDDMIYFGKKWLTGELYKQIAYEYKNITPKTAEKAMAELREIRSELQKIQLENLRYSQTFSH